MSTYEKCSNGGVCFWVWTCVCTHIHHVAVCRCLFSARWMCGWGVILSKQRIRHLQWEYVYFHALFKRVFCCARRQGARVGEDLCTTPDQSRLRLVVSGYRKHVSVFACAHRDNDGRRRRHTGPCFNQLSLNLPSKLESTVMWLIKHCGLCDKHLLTFTHNYRHIQMHNDGPLIYLTYVDSITMINWLIANYNINH